MATSQHVLATMRVEIILPYRRDQTIKDTPIVAPIPSTTPGAAGWRRRAHGAGAHVTLHTGCTQLLLRQQLLLELIPITPESLYAIHRAQVSHPFQTFFHTLHTP